MPLRFALGAILLVSVWSATARLTADIPDAAILSAAAASQSHSASDPAAVTEADAPYVLLSERNRTVLPPADRRLSRSSTSLLPIATAVGTTIRDSGRTRILSKPLLI